MVSEFILLLIWPRELIVSTLDEKVVTGPQIVLLYKNLIDYLLTHWGWYKMNPTWQTPFWKFISLNENYCILGQIYLKFVDKGSI